MKRSSEMLDGRNESSDGLVTKKVKNITRLESLELDGVPREKKFEKGGNPNGHLKGFGNKRRMGKKRIDKPNWTEFKKKKKEVHLKRVQNNPHYEMMIQAKKIWEEIRKHNCPKDKRGGLVEKLYGLLKGNLHTVIHSHDMARTIQCVLKHGSATVRDEVCKELLPHIIPVVLSKYGRFCVKPLFLYSTPENRKKVINMMSGHVVKLLNHTVGTRSLELAYGTWATRSQKMKMRQELYGKMARLEKEDKASCLTELFERAPNLKPAILSTTKSILYKVMTKKHIMISSLLHTVLLDFFNHSDETDRTELIEALADSVMQLLTSRDGTIMAMNIIWHGTNKIKKTIVKSLKGHVKEISELEHGHLLLMAVFDSIDDTVLVKRALIPELLKEAESIASDEIGRRVLLHLTAHWDKVYFHPEEINLLRQGCLNGTSKKDMDVKHRELLDEVIDPLLDLVARNPSNFLASASMGMLALAILKVGKGVNLRSAQTAVAEHVAEPANSKLVENFGMHLVFKKLIQHDVQNVSSGNPTFSSALVDVLSESILKEWVKVNRACFLLILMLECGEEATVNKLRTKIDKDILKLIKKETTTCGKILYKKLNGD